MILLVLLSCLAFYLSVYWGVFGAIPSKAELKSKQNSTASEVYTADGVLIGRYFLQDRTNVKYEEISQDLIKALIATEDVRFYHHKGVDFRSLMRVLFKTLLLQDADAGGGSTLSQQLAKNLYSRKNFRYLSTPINKIREMIIANRLESLYSKEEILELYLNTVPMGGNIYGIERASEIFFNKKARSLNTEEAAVLVGMLKANTTYNPVRNPEKSKARRNAVLGQMEKYGYLPPATSDSLQNLPLRLNVKRRAAKIEMAAYFREQLRRELEIWCHSQHKEDGEPYNLYTDGLKIHTTIDSRIQKQAEKAVREQMSALQASFFTHWRGKNPWGNNFNVVKAAIHQSVRYKRLAETGKSWAEILEVFKKPVDMQVFTWNGSQKRRMSPLDSIRYYMRFLNTGMLSIEPGTGYIKAWVGGIDHQFYKYDHVLSKRQAGSTFKPIVYAAALEKGMNPCKLFENKRISYPQYENWSPQNASGTYEGKYSMKGALAHSVNTVSAQILLRTGIKPTIGLAHRMGIESEIPEVPSIALGTASMSLFELVSAYSIFANNGRALKPVYITSVTDAKNNVILKRAPTILKQAISSQNASVMIELLKGVIDEGSAADLRTKYGLGMEIAGKTGTTQNQADGWFIGITPDLITGVWVGGENPAVHFRSLELGQGARTALPVWARFMINLTRTEEYAGFRFSRFDGVSPELKALLNCPSFVPDEVVEEEKPKKESFFKRIFKKGFNLFKKKKKGEDEPAEPAAKQEAKNKK
ncbi:penicillin-binding protein 1A [Pararcticibacter amylolyticus]|nr:transglycosylase domain-containing protein [Pararcticibacter amylolyticus]